MFSSAIRSRPHAATHPAPSGTATHPDRDDAAAHPTPSSTATHPDRNGTATHPDRDGTAVYPASSGTATGNACGGAATRPARGSAGTHADRGGGVANADRGGGEGVPAGSRLAARRVRDLLRAALRGGEFGSGRLPGEGELMAQFRAPRDVVREALDLLRRDGLVERRRGLGTLTVRDEHVVPGTLPPQDRALDEHLAVGAITPRLLHWAWIPAPRVIAAQL
ncbi:winged helix-turn-helix domain-containing protein, partial [Nocardia wallacei]|uniref:winged helix-turn-helix domain-containing protein n=1 Tax=Nocardia wallacei TaxID=480035 RepID=UPI0024571420